MPVVVKAEGREVHRGALATGHTRIEVGVPDGVTGSVRVAIEAASRALLDEAVPLRPVALRELHVIPHSHVDIGYSDPQPEVERKQWVNFRDALALFEKTKDMPPEARFRWEAEGLWAVESFLEQATEAERRSFAEAVKRGDLELPANLTNLLTGLCHPEELARWTDASRRLKRLYGIETAPVAMHTDIPGLAWPTVTALAQAGVRYFSSGPNYMPNLKPDGGDRIGGTLVEHGDRPFWWVSPSGRERLLMWVAGRGYSWFHGGYVGGVTDAATRGILDYARELTERGYPYEIVQVRYTVGGDNGPVDPNLPRVRGGLERALRDAAARHRLGAGPLRGLRAALRGVAPREAGRPDALLGGRGALERGRGDPGPGGRAAARPGRGPLVDGRPRGVPAGPGRGGLAPGAAVARAHVGRRGQHLGAGPAGRRGPVGVQAGLRGRGRPALAGALRRGRGAQAPRRRALGIGDREHAGPPARRPRGPPRRVVRGLESA